MELRDALCQISEIRAQIARSEVFRGYRSATTGASGLLALAAAAIQPSLIESPEHELGRYLSLWIAVATISALLAGWEMFRRARLSGSPLERQLTLLAIEQFMPCIVVGALLTLVIYRAAPETAWLLPGLWSLVFSLGVFASFRLLPRQIAWVGIYYALCGIACVTWGQGQDWLAPWQMALSFGAGQLLIAAILYWQLERHDASQA